MVCNAGPRAGRCPAGRAGFRGAGRSPRRAPRRAPTARSDGRAVRSVRRARCPRTPRPARRPPMTLPPWRRSGVAGRLAAGEAAIAVGALGLLLGALAQALGVQGLEVDRLHQERRSEEHTSELQSLMRISYA